MNRARILVIDDDDDIRGLLRELLVRAGYDVALAEDGLAGLRSLYASPPSLVILDVAMPAMDGWETLARIRDLTDVPVLMLSARASELDKVRGLRAGADDYVTKPFGRQELLARAAALLRRASQGRDTFEAYADSVLAIDTLTREVRVAGREVALTPLEFRLLAELVRHPNVVLSHDQLLDLVWGSSRAVSRDQVKLYVGYLRRKLGPEGSLIETVRGCGYRYRARRPGRRATGSSRR